MMMMMMAFRLDGYHFLTLLKLEKREKKNADLHSINNDDDDEGKKNGNSKNNIIKLQISTTTTIIIIITIEKLRERNEKWRNI